MSDAGGNRGTAGPKGNRTESAERPAADTSLSAVSWAGKECDQCKRQREDTVGRKGDRPEVEAGNRPHRACSPQ